MNIYEISVNGYTWRTEAAKIHTAISRIVRMVAKDRKLNESKGLEITAKMLIENKTWKEYELDIQEGRQVW